MGKTLYIVAYMQQNTRFSSYPYIKSRNVFKIDGDVSFCNTETVGEEIFALEFIRISTDFT